MQLSRRSLQRFNEGGGCPTVTGLRMSVFQISRNTRNTLQPTPCRSASTAPLTRGGKSEMVEGKLRSRVVVLEFPSFEAALACYRSPEYAAAKKLREPASVADIVVLEGYDGPQP